MHVGGKEVFALLSVDRQKLHMPTRWFAFVAAVSLRRMQAVVCFSVFQFQGVRLSLIRVWVARH